jgi:hypothetical protein
LEIWAKNGYIIRHDSKIILPQFTGSDKFITSTRDFVSFNCYHTWEKCWAAKVYLAGRSLLRSQGIQFRGGFKALFRPSSGCARRRGWPN